MNKLKYLMTKNKCSHEKITPNSIGKFCPDCGKEINITWSILRCKHCSTKRASYKRFGMVLPVDRFCSRCGSTHYFVE